MVIKVELIQNGHLRVTKKREMTVHTIHKCMYACILKTIQHFTVKHRNKIASYLLPWVQWRHLQGDYISAPCPQSPDHLLSNRVCSTPESQTTATISNSKQTQIYSDMFTCTLLVLSSELCSWMTGAACGIISTESTFGVLNNTTQW